MLRRLILGAVLGSALLVMTTRVDAQQSPPSTSSTTTSTSTTLSVLPTTIVNQPTTIVTVPTTLSTPTTLKVAGVVVNRPLPRTGGDFGIQVVIGSALTAVGLAARRDRPAPPPAPARHPVAPLRLLPPIC